MNTDNLNKIETLLKNSGAITGAFNQMEAYKKDSRYDKLGLGFNLDSRFAACDGLTLYVSSWKGVYGDSGCGTILRLDKKIFNEHLVKVLQSKFKEIMMLTAESIEKEAIGLKSLAKKELEEIMNRVELMGL